MKSEEIYFQEFQCKKCAECCRAGYLIHVQKQDIIRWMHLKKETLLDFIIINSDSISLNYGTEINSKDGTAIIYIKKTYKQKEFKNRLEKLRAFIKKNHLYYGKNSLGLNIRTILPNMEYDPILKPKNFLIILKAIEIGIEYIIQLNHLRHCPFLQFNLCIIHDFKPNVCKNFPHTKNKCLRTNV